LGGGEETHTSGGKGITKFNGGKEKGGPGKGGHPSCSGDTTPLRKKLWNLREGGKKKLVKNLDKGFVSSMRSEGGEI